jgi:predicted GIY-YIG superfamily endonuclease
MIDLSDSGSCDLYRFFDADETLLYVGISLNAAKRASQHRKDKPWWPDVATMTVERHDTREAALEAEAEAIRSERPLHNVQHNRPGCGSGCAQPSAQPSGPVWRCAVCDQIVAPRTGYVCVDMDKAIRCGQWWRDRRDRIERAPDGAQAIRASLLTTSELIETGNLIAKWSTLHRRCDPNPDSRDYWMDIDGLVTWADLLRANAHVLEKAWTKNTDWASFICRACP